MLLNTGILPIDATSSQVLNTIEESTENVAKLIQQGRFEELWHQLIVWGIDFIGKLLLSLVIFYVGKWIIKKISKFFDKLLRRRNMDTSLRNFLRTVISGFLFAILIFLIINIVGLQTVSLAALIGSIGLAVGLAVKDNLSNFAGGVMLLFNKPFKTGDSIEVQNLSGTVQSIGILYTQLVTFDGRRVYIPNGPLSTGNIVNFSAEPNRRLEFVIGVDFGSDINEVKAILLDIVNDHPKILKDPAPAVVLKTINNSSVDFSVRVFTTNPDYGDVNFDLNEMVYNKLKEKGIKTPFQQMILHWANNNDEKKGDDLILSQE